MLRGSTSWVRSAAAVLLLGVTPRGAVRVPSILGGLERCTLLGG